MDQAIPLINIENINYLRRTCRRWRLFILTLDYALRYFVHPTMVEPHHSTVAQIMVGEHPRYVDIRGIMHMYIQSKFFLQHTFSPRHGKSSRSFARLGAVFRASLQHAEGCRLHARGLA